MKKTTKILLFSLGIILSIGVITPIIYFQFNHKIPDANQTNNYAVSINGAVENPGIYSFKKPKKIREIIFKANVLPTADLSTIELDKTIENDCELVVPYKINSVKKIKWKNLKDVSQLTSLGVKNSVAQTIIEHRRQNESTTWEQILALKGIGKVTVAQLKDLIDLS